MPQPVLLDRIFSWINRTTDGRSRLDQTAPAVSLQTPQSTHKVWRLRVCCVAKIPVPRNSFRPVWATFHPYSSTFFHSYLQAIYGVHAFRVVPEFSHYYTVISNRGYSASRNCTLATVISTNAYPSRRHPGHRLKAARAGPEIRHLHVRELGHVRWRAGRAVQRSDGCKVRVQ